MAFAWIGMILAIAGPGVYFFLLDHAFLRSTGVAAFVLMVPGAVLGLPAFWRGRRWRVRLPGLFSVLMLVLFAGSFFWLLRLPASEVFAKLERAPDFTVPDHVGNEFNLSKALADGPVLLVFYRGFW
jgi:hypothetical protein